jgi:hypothetical protein
MTILKNQSAEEMDDILKKTQPITPMVLFGPEDTLIFHRGLSKREFFAAQALGVYANNGEFAEKIAWRCVLLADAIIAELAKEEME